MFERRLNSGARSIKFQGLTNVAYHCDCSLVAEPSCGIDLWLSSDNPFI
jgi:hypothetical protein